MNNLKWGSLISLLLIVIAFTAAGCGGIASASGYAIFKFPEDDIRFKLKGTLIHEHPLFSFEYPQSFAKVNDDDEILLNMRVTLVTFARQPNGGAESLPKSNLSVSVHEPGLWSDSDAKTTITNIITYHIYDRDFKVLDRSSTSIEGINAESLTYSFNQPAREGFGYSPIPSYNGVVKFVCFDHEGFIWRACLSCLEEELPETEVYFQHIIDTFQILD